MNGPVDAGPPPGQPRPDVRVFSSQGVQIGDNTVQYNLYVDRIDQLTWSDRVLPPPLAEGSSPYRGLAPFGEQDALYYFGREGATAHVLEQMAACVTGPGLMVVSGVSGAGKSSLLRAGVLPELREAGLPGLPGAASWPCLAFTPGRSPLDQLAIRAAAVARTDAITVQQTVSSHPAGFALTAQQAVLAHLTWAEAGPAARPGDPQRLLIVVDQFEEVFTQCADETQRRAFITALHAAATTGNLPGATGAALVVLGVRADFEARCAGYPELAGAIQDRYLVTPMTRRQLRMAITEPAKKAGSNVDADLVEVLLGEVGSHQPSATAGVLPLLSHALDQSWRSRAGGDITLADYERTGGIEGAVAASAERAFQSLTGDQQALARQIFTRLTVTSDDGTDTAARVSRAELTEHQEPDQAGDTDAVLEAFAAERLLILDSETVEISHEILLTAWPLLRGTWLAETRDDRMVLSRLRNSAAEWVKHDRDGAYLYSGSVLENATAIAARIADDPARHPPLSRTEHTFLQASDRAQRRRTRWRTIAIAVLAATSVILAGAGVLVLLAQQNAVHQRDTAISDEVAIRSETIGNADPGVAKLLSLAAWRISPTAEAHYAMLDEAALPGIAALSGHTGPVNAIAISPDGRFLASGGDDRTVRLWHLPNGQPIGKPLPISTGRVKSVAFSPDGKLLAVSTVNGTVQLWSVATGKPAGPVRDSRNRSMNTVAFSPNGQTLATGSENGTLQLWDIPALTPDGPPLASHSRAIYSVAFGRDGTTLASGNQTGTVQLWDVSTRQPIGQPLLDDNGSVLSVAFSQDGKTLAVGGNSGARLWDVATGRSIGRRFSRNTRSVFSVAFSPDGRTLVTGSQDSSVRLWDLATRRETGQPLTGNTDWVFAVAFSSDGRTVASGGRDDIVRLWQIPAEPEIRHTGAVSSMQFSPDGVTLAVGGQSGTAQVWNVAARNPAGTPVGRLSTSFVDGSLFDANGRLFASVGGGVTPADTWTRVWNMASGKEIGAPIHTGRVYAMAFSPDGTTLATSDNHGTVRLWDVGQSRPPAGSLRATPARSSRWRSARTGPLSPAPTGGSSCGMWPLVSQSAMPCPRRASSLAR